MVPALLIALGCSAGGGSPDAEEVAAGQKRFLQTCAICHGLDGKGSPGLGKNLHSNQFVQGRSDDGLVEFLKVGRPASDPQNDRGIDMPPRGGNPALQDGDLRLIGAYLRSLQ
jgi:mono/diheme cytochrome c family protein